MFIVKCTVYPYDIMVYFGKKKKLEKILKKYNLSIKGVGLTTGKTIMFESNQTLLWLKDEPKEIRDLAVLQHEIFHCVCFILDKVGIKFSNDNDEAFAYFIQYLTNEIYKELKMFK